MRSALVTFVCWAWLLAAGTSKASQAAQASSAASRGNSTAETLQIDGIAARIEDDVLLDSEVRSLGEFQQLVDGKEKSRSERITELADQWIVRGEARTAQYPQPSLEDVDRAYAQLTARFASPEEFRKRCASLGLREETVRQQLEQQLYLSRFLDYRFRPAVQVNQKQIDAYYNNELVPQLKAHHEPVPDLESVEDSIREALVQRRINERAAQWLDETRQRVKIDIAPAGERP